MGRGRRRRGRSWSVLRLGERDMGLLLLGLSRWGMIGVSNGMRFDRINLSRILDEETIRMKHTDIVGVLFAVAHFCEK